MVPGPIAAAGGSAPADPAALALAKKWIVAATPPPGVQVLSGPPAGAPRKPATLPACAWLVQATKWWSAPASEVDAVKGWLRAHPVAGLSVDGMTTGPGRLSSLSERPPHTGDDSLGFEFAPNGGTVTIRVDAVVIPAGSTCISGEKRS